MACGNLIDVLYGNRAPTDPAFLLPGGAMLSTRDALERIDQAAGALAACGIRKGDRVSVRVEKCVDAVLLAHACFKMGAIVHPINGAYTLRETRTLLADARPSLLICNPGELEDFADLAETGDIRLEGLSAKGGSFADLMAKAYPPPEAVEQPRDGVAALLYTSGTTGTPKGALITHRNLAESAKSLAVAWKLSKEDLLLHALPVFHAHGLLTSINVMLASGGAVCLVRQFSPELVLPELARCTVMMGVPTYYARVLKEPALETAFGQKFRLAISGSAPLSPDVADGFRRVTGIEIIERYGSTEAAIITAVPAGVKDRRGWVGWALPGIEVRVSNGDERFSVGVGSLETRGHNVFAGYWRNDGANSEAFTEDGWFVAGDLAEIDEAGCVRILGREKDLIISGGLNVYPKEVEDAVDRSRGVETSAVFGVPHPDFGEAVVAVVETDASRLFDEQSCVSHLKEELASYKVPKRIIPVESIERNELGKVAKDALRKRFQALFAGED